MFAKNMFYQWAFEDSKLGTISTKEDGPKKRLSLRYEGCTIKGISGEICLWFVPTTNSFRFRPRAMLTK